MNLSHLRYLRLVVEEGSLSAAARVAGISQPAMSVAMKVLEKSLGTSLFEGQGRLKKPTAAALVAARHASALEAGMAKVSKGAGRPGSQGSRYGLRIGMSPVAALLYGVLVAETWRKHAREGALFMAGGGAPNLLRALQRAELDLVVGPRPRHFSLGTLKSAVLFSSRPTVYCRAGHPMAAARSLAELKGVEWVMVCHENAPGDMIEEALRVRRLGRAKVPVQCSDYASCLRLVTTSDMMCVVPHDGLVEELRPGRVRPVHIAEGLPQYDICVFSPESPSSSLAGAVDELIQILLPTSKEAPAAPGRAAARGRR